MAIGEPSFPSADITSAALATFDTPAVESPTTESAPAPPPQTSSTPAAVARPAAQTAQTPARSTQVDSSGAAIDPNATYTVTYKVNGQDVTESVTGKDIPSRMMNYRSYTQKTQDIAAERRAIFQERQGINELRAQAQRVQEQDALLNDAGKLAVYIQSKFPQMTVGQAQAAAAQVQQNAGVVPQAPPVPSIDPQALANFGDVQDAVQRRMEDFRQEFGRNANAAEQRAIQQVEERAAAIAEKTVAQTIAKLQHAHAVAGYDRQIDSHINSLVQEHPVLTQVPELNDLLRFRASRLDAQTPEDLFNGITSIAKAIAEGFDAHYNTQRTVAVAAKAKLTTHGMATPSGVTPTAPTPEASKPFTSGGKADWKGLSAQVGAAFDAMRQR